MSLVEPHHIRTLLESAIPGATLVLDEGEIRVVADAHVHHAIVVIDKETLVDKLEAGGMSPDQLTDDHVRHMAMALNNMVQKPNV
ncbi:ACT domain-containing protein [Herbidospora sp. RD11066]